MITQDGPGAGMEIGGGEPGGMPAFAHDHADGRRGCPQSHSDGCRRPADAVSRKACLAAIVISALVAGIVAGYGVALPVGAVATYLVALGVRERFGVAAAAALGAATTDGFFAAIAVFGGVGLQRALRPVSTPLTYASAAILVALAMRTVLGAVRRHRDIGVTATTDLASPDPLRTYLSLVGITAANPSTLVYFAALVIGAEPQRGSATWSGCVFALGALVASASWQLLLAGSGAILGRVLTSSRGQLSVALLCASIMVALAARLLL